MLPHSVMKCYTWNIPVLAAEGILLIVPQFIRAGRAIGILLPANYSMQTFWSFNGTISCTDTTVVPSNLKFSVDMKVYTGSNF